MSKYEDAAYTQELEAKVEALQAKVDQLAAENKQLRAEISHLKGVPAARDGLTFDRGGGVYRDQSGKEFCPKCLDREKRNPLHGDAYRWKCAVCGTGYPKPDAPRPRVISEYNPLA